MSQLHWRKRRKLAGHAQQEKSGLAPCIGVLPNRCWLAIPQLLLLLMPRNKLNFYFWWHTVRAAKCRSFVRSYEAHLNVYGPCASLLARVSGILLKIRVLCWHGRIRLNSGPVLARCMINANSCTAASLRETGKFNATLRKDIDISLIIRCARRSVFILQNHSSHAFLRLCTWWWSSNFQIWSTLPRTKPRASATTFLFASIKNRSKNIQELYELKKIGSSSWVL
jgi:hypothetical protein